MIFGSLEEMVAHIKVCNGVASKEMADKSKEEAAKIIESELMGWQGSTGDTAKTPTTVSASSSMMEVELKDNGGWFSVITGEHFFSIDGLEGGTTWGRGKSSIMNNWNDWCSSNLDRIYLASMRGQGVPIG